MSLPRLPRRKKSEEASQVQAPYPGQKLNTRPSLVNISDRFRCPGDDRLHSTAVQVIAPGGQGRAALNKVSDNILDDLELKLAQEVLPDNYNLEISKVTWKREKTSIHFTLTDHLEDAQRWLKECGSAAS